VVSVGEDDAGLELVPKIALVQTFDRCLGTDGHEDGRWDVPMFGVQNAGARLRNRAFGEEFKGDLAGQRLLYCACATLNSMMISLDEYLSTVFEPDCEYVDGELVDRNTGELEHSALQGVIMAMLHNQRFRHGIHVFPVLSMQVAATRVRVPDITVTTHKIQGRILRKPLFLCIEVLSPEDRASRIETKIDDYLSFGVEHIWIVDPRERRGWSYTREGKRESTEVLTTSDPRLTLSLREVFDALSEAVDE
jgi:Uma2 family endonuclease